MLAAAFQIHGGAINKVEGLTRFLRYQPLHIHICAKSFYYDEGTYLTTTATDGTAIDQQAASPWLYIVPQGMEDILYWIDDRYGKPDIYITENGVDIAGESDMTNSDRIDYYDSYIGHTLAAKEGGVII